MSEVWERGESRGWTAANFAVAYENATKSSEPPDYATAADEAGYSHPADLLNFGAGFSAGWYRYMREDYPD